MQDEQLAGMVYGIRAVCANEPATILRMNGEAKNTMYTHLGL